MAKFLVLDKRHYDPQTGLIPLRRGDDWTLAGQCIEKKGTYQSPVDLTGGAATAFFPDPTGLSPVAATVVFSDAAQGLVSINLPAVDTPNVGLAEGGSSMYLVFRDTGGNTLTMETPDDALEIKDRGFDQT